ncbi:4-hydroxythreonine-4-phosphate dehydrogenase PdxA [Porphyromonas pogonae]|uniref:4-hydroxythreonine-4-phosphate dehydrogenase PdxA n=1 Tax=Porphyromonas pogonae TaxID=867595 RepID=UPI002E79FE52|nr:4-hydroxythreonine-4-phosphate dehydrogenase PdxA [Porphyromonas pogonae]
MDRKIRVAITHGDINGISYEVILKALADESMLDLCTPVIYGSTRVASYWKKKLEIEGNLTWNQIRSTKEVRDGVINLLNISDDDFKVTPGMISEDGGRAALIALEKATSDVMMGYCDVLVTAPINKAAMPRDAFPYNGHTQYLEDKCAMVTGRSLMILCAYDVRVALVTTHIPVSDVPGAITEELILEKLGVLDKTLRRDFGIGKPRIAVLSLNPHAGDSGLIGSEEISVIKPAIDKAFDSGIMTFGPYAADGFWGSDVSIAFDGVLAMYHDQGLAPFKALYMNSGVNITAGLSIVRTSPDHGTGYDIVGKNEASEESMRHAIFAAIDIYRNRAEYDYITRNPLRKIYYSGGKDDEKIDLTADSVD